MATRRPAKKKSPYRIFKAEAEGQVVRWQWADGRLYDPRPFSSEILGIRPGELLEGEPADRAGMYELGLDADGRLVVSRHYNEIPGQVGEEFFRYMNDRIVAAYYNEGDKERAANSVIHLEGGRPVAYERTGVGTWVARETYHYEGDRLIRIETFLSTQTPQTRVFELTWDDDGALESIAQRTRTGTLFPVYKPRRRVKRRR